MNNESIDLHTALKAATAEAHERIETVPFIKALFEGELPSLSIVSLLRALSIVHAVFERCFSKVSDSHLIPFCQAHEPKLPLLLTDLKKVKAESVTTIIPAIEIAIQFSDEILKNSKNPYYVLGVLYVLEGSQNGGVGLKKLYAQCLGLQAEDLTYFGSYGSRTASIWKTFITNLNSLSLKKEEVDQITQAAVLSFHWIEKIFIALYPLLPSQLNFHVTDHNPEAGNHSMPQDPLEIDLALRAGRKAWERFPYLEERYGDRGKRFTSSDSCWLVSFYRLPPAVVTNNLSWLRTVLSTRGLPVIILEKHLIQIKSEFKLLLGDHASLSTGYDPFLSHLRTEREGIIEEGVLSSLLIHYNDLFNVLGGSQAKSTAELIAFSWIDEKCRIKGSLEAVRCWFTNSARFSPEWIQHVNELIGQLDASLALQVRN